MRNTLFFPLRMQMLLIAGLALGSYSFAQGTTFWYVDNLPDVWFYQPDVFAFRCINGQAFTGTVDSALVDSIVYHSDRRDHAVEVYFNPTATPADRIAEIQEIFASGQLEMPYITVTRDTLKPYEEEEWFVIDNLLIVTFKQAYPSQADIDDFMNRYNLTLFSEPSPNLPYNTSDVSHAYVFEVHLPVTANSVQTAGVSFDYFLELARGMFVADAAFVNSAEPNIVNFRAKEEETTFAGSMAQGPAGEYNCPSNDPLYGEMNHIENLGNNVPYRGTGQFPSVPNGTVGADAKICDCWSQGLSGSGVTIGVIGSDHFCLNQTDMTGKFDISKVWDCTSGTCVTLTSNCSGGMVSGMRIASLIGAKGNNGTGAIGVAPDAMVAVYKISSNYASTTSLVAALQRVLQDGVDVVATDYFNSTYSQAVDQTIGLLGQQGRNYKGIVVVAPAGYTSAATGSTANFYPAAGGGQVGDGFYPPIKVIASNRFDLLCTQEIAPATGGLKYALPSHYGAQYDVAAPGVRIPHSWNNGVSPYAWAYQPHTGAVATVAGIAAMILQYQPGLTSIQVRQAVIAGVDKVGGYSYTLWGGTKSQELAHGRVNCGQSVASIYTSVLPPVPSATLAVQQQTGILLATLSTPSRENLTLNIYSIGGQNLQQHLLTAGQTEVAVPTQRLVPGLYLLSVSAADGTVVATTKASVQ